MVSVLLILVDNKSVMQHQHVSLCNSSPLSGYMVVPAGGGGTFLGGYIVKRLNLRCRGIIRFCMMCAIVSLLTIFIFLIHCPNVPMAGVTAPYKSSPAHQQDQYKHLYDKPSKLRLRNRWGMFPCCKS